LLTQPANGEGRCNKFRRYTVWRRNGWI